MVSFNVWSGSDYLKNVNDIYANMELSSTEFWASNGNRSIQITSNTTGYQAATLCEITANINETYTGKLDILNPTSDVYLRLIEVESSQYTDVTISSSNVAQESVISKQVTGSGTFRFLLITRSSLTCYIDNVRLTR